MTSLRTNMFIHSARTSITLVLKPDAAHSSSRPLCVLSLIVSRCHHSFWLRTFSSFYHRQISPIVVDSITVATYSPTQDQKNVWTQIGTTDASQAILVAPAQGSSTQHTVSLRVTTLGFANKDIFAADDFSITAVAGPLNAPICSTASV